MMLHWQYEPQENGTQTIASASVDAAFVIIETQNNEKRILSPSLVIYRSL